MDVCLDLTRLLSLSERLITGACFWRFMPSEGGGDKDERALFLPAVISISFLGGVSPISLTVSPSLQTA